VAETSSGKSGRFKLNMNHRFYQDGIKLLFCDYCVDQIQEPEVFPQDPGDPALHRNADLFTICVVCDKSTILIQKEYVSFTTLLLALLS